MKAVVIGLGSMGKRRIRLLRENFPDIDIFGVDQNRKRCEGVRREFNIKTSGLIHDFSSTQKIDYAFVCASPLSHAGIISSCLENNINVFTEINLVSEDYQKNILLAEKRRLVLFLSSTFLYRSEVNFIMGKISQTKNKLYYTYHVGQYLPDWHPWETVNDFFVSDKKTNGCRELFAIELPWLIKAFGKIKEIQVKKDNVSGLSLGYPDIYFVTIEHESGHCGCLCVDVATRMPVRHFEVFGKNLQIEWRGIPEKLSMADDDFKEMRIINMMENINRIDGYRDFGDENAYLEEIKEFFAVCNGKENDKYTFVDDFYTLNLIDQIEQR
jgi:predicted dehydrogenase